MDIINNVLDFLGFDDDYEPDPVEIYYSIVEKNALSSLGKIPGSQWNEKIVNYV